VQNEDNVQDNSHDELMEFLLSISPEANHELVRDFNILLWSSFSLVV
jgi:hypothetical protein